MDERQELVASVRFARQNLPTALPFFHLSKDLSPLGDYVPVRFEDKSNNGSKAVNKALKVLAVTSITGPSPVRWAEQVGEQGFTVRNWHGCQL